MTSLKQISLFTEEKLIFSQEDSLVNHIQVQESDLAKKMKDISGLKCCEQLEKFNRVGLWAKMFADLLIGMEGWYSTKCNLIWKIKATKSHRIYFQLQPSMLPIEETGFGLLPTPLASEGGKMSKSPTENQMSLTKLARTQMLPTPTLQDARIGMNNIGGSKHRMERGSIALADIALRLTNRIIPTPTAMDSTNATATMKSTQVKEGSMHSVTLSRFVNTILPTPNQRDYKGHSITENHPEGFNQSLPNAIAQMNLTNGKTSHLNPLFVEEMMGFPKNWTASPFQNGGKNQSKHTETQ
jgi:hypothetical protein